MVTAQTTRASATRSAGRRPMNQPNAGPTAAEHSTPTISTVLAAPELNPAPSTRYGRPHSTPNAVAVDMTRSAPRTPSGWPGSDHDAATRSVTVRSPRRTSAALRSRRGAAARSSSSAHTATAATSESAPAMAKLAVQPSRSQRLRQRQGGEHVADHPDQRRERDQRRVAARAEPGGDEAQHADEGHRVAAAEQRPGSERRRVRRRDREQQLAQAHQQSRPPRAAGAGRTGRPARRSGSASPRRRRSAA